MATSQGRLTVSKAYLAAAYRRVLVILALGVVTATSSAALAESGAEVLRAALDRHEERTEGVSNFTVVQEAMGFESTTYYERTEVDGRSMLVPQSVGGSEAAGQAPAGMYDALAKLADRADYEGTRQLDETEVHVVTATDIADLDLFGEVAPDEGEFTPEQVTLMIGTGDYLLQSMTVEGTLQMPEGERNMSYTARFRDYREVDGVEYPYVTEVAIEGLEQMMSAEEQAQMRESITEMQEQMKAMSGPERQMMERMMGPQMEQMEKMLAQGAMNVTIEVKELRVNDGPPEAG